MVGIPKQWHADCQRANSRDYVTGCRQKFETGEIDPKKVVEEYKNKNLLSRAISTFFCDDVRLEYDTARSFLEEKVSEK